jgi:putative flippase GtrA
LKRGTLVGQLWRFLLSGGIVTAFMMTAVSGLILIADLDDQLALALAYAGGIALHFTLNRQFVFHGHDYALGLTAQGGRYLAAALASYGLTALAMATLPGALGVPTLTLYFVVAVILGLVTFVVFRALVFRGEDTPVRSAAARSATPPLAKDGPE